MKTRIKAPSIPELTDRTSAELALQDLATLANAQRKIIADRDAEMLKIGERCAPHLAKIENSINSLTQQLQRWAEANPSEFPKDRKSIPMSAGTIGFRTGTPKLALLSRAWSWDKVLSSIKLSGFFPSFIRTKEEVDKDAILGDYSDKIVADFELTALGLKVTQTESFFIEPNLTDTDPRQTITTK